MSIIPTPPRSSALELLDLPGVDAQALADNLRDLRQADRFLGATALIWRHLWPLLRRLPRGRTITLLDVATGSGAGPHSLAARARRKGYDLRPLASDRLMAALRYARASGLGLPLLQHDALAIPLRDKAVDIATCALALHHFEPGAAAVLLRELGRVARCGVIVVDLQRGWLAYWGARLLALGLWRGMARHDGPLSVLRAYTPEEARALAAQADLRHAHVVAHRPFRIALVARRGASGADTA